MTPVSIATQPVDRELEAFFSQNFSLRYKACRRVRAQGMARLLALAGLLALALLLAGCGSSPKGRGASGGEAMRTVPRTPHVPLNPESADSIAIHALGLVGTPYRYGGNTPDSGFDCSGLIGYVYRSEVGTPPPRTVASLYNWGQQIDAAELRTGDMVLFGRGRPHHAGIYVGDGRFVHAPSSGGTVRLDVLTSGYWARQHASYRRP